MSYATMAVIPMDEYTQMQSLLKTRSPLDSQLKTLTQTYHQHEGLVDSNERSFQQGQDMFHIQRLKEKMRSHLSNVTPKPFRARAEQLLRFLDPYITFNEHGELLNRNVGASITGSRIDDLIQHAVREKRRRFTPVGWSDFVHILRVNNAPKMLLNKSTIDEMDGNFLVRPTTRPRRMPISLSPRPTARHRPISASLSPPILSPRSPSPIAHPHQRRKARRRVTPKSYQNRVRGRSPIRRTHPIRPLKREVSSDDDDPDEPPRMRTRQYVKKKKTNKTPFRF